MTAVDVDALDKLRSALAAEVRAFIVAAVGEDMGPGMTEQAEELTARLLPVVDRIANERAAAELDAAAEDIPRSDSEVGAKQILRDRAAALREPTS